MGDFRYESHAKDVKRARKEAAIRALNKIGLYVVAQTKRKAPVDTGRYRNSFTHKVDEQNESVHPGTNMEYGPFVELGTRFMEAQPSLTPAVEENIGAIKDIAAKEMKSLDGG